MSTDRDPTRVVLDWLREPARVDGERVLSRVLDQLGSTPQRRFWRQVWGFPMRFDPRMGVAAIGVVVLTFVGVQLIDQGIGGPGTSMSPAAAPPTSSLRPAPTNDNRTHRLLDGVGFSFIRLPADGWEDFGFDYPNYISKSVRGPQGAEAELFWTPISGRRNAGECHYLRTEGFGTSAADLAAIVASVPGTDLSSRPAEVTVGGRPAWRVDFIVREDVGCDPGFFFTYPNLHGGALWPETFPGDTVRVWIVDLGDERFFIEGKTHDDAGPALEQEIQRFVDSIQFE